MYFGRGIFDNFGDSCTIAALCAGDSSYALACDVSRQDACNLRWGD
jgi:hypothetical protein